MRVRVQPYDPNWVEDFDLVHAALREALRGVAVHAVEHIGSTSVPGLAAKPVIDIDVIVAPRALADAVAALERAGYRHLGEMGVPERHAFEAPGGPRRHVYVVVEGSLALRNHLAVREALRTDPAARDEYGSLKQRLAEADHASMDDYVEAKSSFLQTLLRQAGFTEDELAAVAEVNRVPGR